MKADYVLRFKRFVRNAIWGSESWEISAHHVAPSVISNGPLAGLTLPEVCPDFPLLVKVIDAKSRLSVQVHLNDHIAPILGGEPKAEMWCMLGDGEIYAGLVPDTTRRDVAEAVESGRFSNLLVKHVAQRGDAYFIPGGMVHAIGANSRLYEVQQSSDTTYRLYDWGRVDANGKPRELHVEKGLSAINYALPIPEPQKNVDCQYFDFRQMDVAGRVDFAPEEVFVVLFVEAGSVTVNCEELHEGESALVPPGVAFSLSSDFARVFMTRSK
jgi:mannose-6-phosphate isomerase